MMWSQIGEHLQFSIECPFEHAASSRNDRVELCQLTRGMLVRDANRDSISWPLCGEQRRFELSKSYRGESVCQGKKGGVDGEHVKMPVSTNFLDS